MLRVFAPNPVLLVHVRGQVLGKWMDAELCVVRMSAWYKIVLEGLSGSKSQKQNSSRTGFTACIGNLVAGRYLLLVVTYMEIHGLHQ
jgi:hypothetical protein